MMWRFDGAQWDKMADLMEKGGCGKFMWGGYWQIHWILGLVTWLLVIALLVVLIRYFWRKNK